LTGYSLILENDDVKNREKLRDGVFDFLQILKIMIILEFDLDFCS